ncbi:MAG TPA: OB-fold nucleic acid binding domain-containing protein [Candidatus Nanoarchaeia archaeon]|nr:OB-fold nucleic acid binding domain-containing protein [Candidatus Nanoarchaeia archaeon]
MADFKRQTAFKLKIGDIFSGKPIIENERFTAMEINGKAISRVNLVANVVEKYSSAEKKYISLTIDDASGQIRLKIFGDEVDKFHEVNQGETVLVVGLLRQYNDELYITPEIVKPQDPRYLLVRKLEFDKPSNKIVSNNDIIELSSQIIKKIKESEPEGIGSEKLILELKDFSPELINQEIKKALEQGVIYEPRPGVLRYLGM